MTLFSPLRNSVGFASGFFALGLGIFITGALLSPRLRRTYHTIRARKDANDGRVLFLANCAPCHGRDARGGRGPALVGRQLSRGSSEEEVLSVVQDGIPGTTMPAFAGSEDELGNLVEYVRTLSAPLVESRISRVNGDQRRGAAVYQRNGCGMCHLIGGVGSVFGPELTRVGAGRSYGYLKRALLDPSAEIAPDQAAVTVTTAAGRRVTGIRVNEDTFTLQLRDNSQGFVTFEKSELRSVQQEAKSLMPSYGSLPTQDLEDLLAYLSALHGEVKAGASSAARGLR